MKDANKNMKVLALIMLILDPVLAFGQIQVTRYTPKGSPVRAYNNIPEMSSTDKVDWSTSVANVYPNATELNSPSATRTYNCHAYAWHIREGGDAVWIGYYQGQEADEDIYWTDGSYNNQSSEVGAEKISYYNGNHSAVQTNTQGVYVSKWGEGPLMQHSRDYGPSIYNMAYRNYYKKALQPTISGPSQICTQGTYTVNNLPTGATVDWSYSTTNLQSVQIGNENITLSPIGNGWGTINATVTIGSSQFALPQKTVWVGLKASFTGSSSVNYLSTGFWESAASCGAEPYIFEWYLRKAGTGVSALRVSNDQTLTLQSVPEGTSLSVLNAKVPIVNQPITYTIFYSFLRVTDANGIQYDTSEQQIYAYGKVDLVPLELLRMNESTQPSITAQSKSVEISPNPTSTQVEVNIADETSSTLLSAITSTDTSYTVTVIDSYGSTVYSGIKKEKKFNIPTSTFRNGIYFVLVSDGTNVYQNKLIVKH